MQNSSSYLRQNEVRLHCIDQSVNELQWNCGYLCW